MNLLQDVITYIRRIIKTPSNAQITDNLIIDYINRFWIMDVDARIQLFDLKKKYQFQTAPGVDQYNMPLYNIQTEPGNQQISFYPVYQGFLGPAYINGIEVAFQTQREAFFRVWPNVVQQLNSVVLGDGTSGPYNIQIPLLDSNAPNTPPVNGILRGHVDMSGIIATGTNQDPPFVTTINTNIPTTSIFPSVYITSVDVNGNSIVVSDSGQFLSFGGIRYPNLGLLMTPGNAPFGNTALSGGYNTTTNVVNYLTGEINVTFPLNVQSGAPINIQVIYFQTGLPRALLYYNNTITLRSPPDKQYLVELDAYLTPAAFLSGSDALPFGYMSEYIARGAARKILADTGDVEQFQFYEPLFKEQEMLVWKRSQRQWTSTRSQTIYSQGMNLGQSGFMNQGGIY